jgi:hypothetical protein
MAFQPLVELPPVVCISWQRTLNVFHEGSLPSDDLVLRTGDGGGVVAVKALALGVIFKRMSNVFNIRSRLKCRSYGEFVHTLVAPFSDGVVVGYRKKAFQWRR